MRLVDTKLILPYADRNTDASFQCSESLIYIHNSYGRLQAYIGCTIAALLIVLPMIRNFLPGTTSLIFDGPTKARWFWMVVYLFTILVTISGGFCWSTIRADPKTGRIERVSRWGPFKKRTVTNLAAFNEVRLERSDGDTTVELYGREQMQLVWGRRRNESVRIAREIAARVALPLSGEDENDGEAA